MNNREEMISSLLDGLSLLQEFHEPPETVAPQFAFWLQHVATSLAAAGMDSECDAWNNALERVQFCPDESSMYAQMNSMKAILLGMLNKVSNGAPAGELLEMGILEDMPSYVQRIAAQASGCYERGWYDACAVMMRRLIETLIIDCFEARGLESQITGADGNYFGLGELIARFLAASWHMSRNTRSSLPRLRDIKDIGDMSAHSRTFLATRRDIERHAQDFRIVVQELAYIVGSGR